MGNELVRVMVSVLAVLGSASFILAAVRMVFFFGQLVKGQEQLSGEVRQGAASFEKFAAQIHEILENHDGRISNNTRRLDLRDAVDQERRLGFGRRADDQP